MTVAATVGEVPARLVNAHLYVTAHVAGHELGFLIDTGAAATLLSMRAARELSLKIGQRFEARGGGSGSVQGALLAEPVRVTMGAPPGLTHDVRAAIALDRLEPHEGRRIEGILGADFLAGYVTELDYEHSRVRFHDAAAFRYVGSGRILPMVLRNGHPHVQGAITDGDAEIATDFVIDVGSALGLSLTHRHVVSHAPIERLGTNVRVFAGRGIGGPSIATVGRAATLRIGPVALPGVVPLLFGDQAGVMSTGEFFDANVGGDILRRFTVFFDYERQQIILEPNASIADPYLVDVSGLAITSDDGRPMKMIDAVVDGSAAALAGALAGDEILCVNDASASELSLDEVRAAFRMPGSGVDLIVGRGHETLRLTIGLPSCLVFNSEGAAGTENQL